MLDRSTTLLSAQGVALARAVDFNGVGGGNFISAGLGTSNIFHEHTLARKRGEMEAGRNGG